MGKIKFTAVFFYRRKSMNINQRQCIYCFEIADKMFFNTEHIVPYSMIKGKGVQDNITLNPTLHKYCVCEGCNKYFDNQFDCSLARDSIDSLFRLEHGLLNQGKTVGNLSRLSIKRADGSRISLSQGHGERVARALPQVRIFDESKQKYNYFDIEQLPVLLANNFELTFEAINCSDNHMNKIYNIVKVCGRNVYSKEAIQEADEMHDLLVIEGRADIDISYKRVIAKIAFNYLAFVLNGIAGSLIMVDDFNSVRRFVRYAEAPDFTVVETSTRHIKRQAKARHYLTLVSGTKGIRKVFIARLCLFNSMPWNITLTNNYQGIIYNLHREHEWDLENSVCKQIAC